MPSCTGSRRPRRGGGGGGSVLRLLVVAVAAVVAFLCGGCFVAGCWGTGVLRSGKHLAELDRKLVESSMPCLCLRRIRFGFIFFLCLVLFFFFFP